MTAMIAAAVTWIWKALGLESPRSRRPESFGTTRLRPSVGDHASRPHVPDHKFQTTRSRPGVVPIGCAMVLHDCRRNVQILCPKQLAGTTCSDVESTDNRRNVVHEGRLSARWIVSRPWLALPRMRLPIVRSRLPCNNSPGGAIRKNRAEIQRVLSQNCHPDNSRDTFLGKTGRMPAPHANARPRTEFWDRN